MVNVVVDRKYLAYGTKTLLSLFIVILLTKTISAEIVINEIMYDPLSNGYDAEYIEIFSENSLNLSGYVIEDLNGNDALTEAKHIDSNHMLIVGTGFNYTNINATIYVCENTKIANGLNNGGDVLILKDTEGEIVEAVHYFDFWGANGNGFSLCKIPDSEGFWQECQTTPGSTNSLFSTEYKLQITEFIPDPYGYDDAPIPDGEWIEIYNQGDNEIDLEGFIINDNYGNGLAISDTNVIETTVIKPKEYLVIYRNEDGKLELNNDGDKITLYNPLEKIIDEVSYSNSKEDVSWSNIEGKWYLTIPTPNEENFYKEHINESEVEISKIYLGSDDIAKFGDMIRTKLEITKGDTTKKSIKIFIENDDEEKISKTSKINIERKFINTTVTIPIQTYPNCDSKYKDGEYYIIMEGLDTKEKERIEFKGINKDLCKEIEKECETETESTIKECPKTISTNLNAAETNINPSIVFESTKTKSKGLTIYFFVVLLILMIIIQTKWRK